jgi:hypothetical protein
MRSTKKQAIRNALLRLGLHTPAKGIVEALAQEGIQVDEQLVTQVCFEMLKDSTVARIVTVSRVPSPTVRRRPQGFPGRQGGRM